MSVDFQYFEFINQVDFELHYYFILTITKMSNQMQPRRYIAGERSSQKQTYRPSYEQFEPLSHSTHSQTDIPTDMSRYGSSAHLVVPTNVRMKYSDMPRSPSASGLKTREQHIKGNIAKRNNQGIVSNLKSQLQNLKLQVSRIMNKEGDTNKTFSSRNSGVHSATQEFQEGDSNILGQYGKDISDSVSVTSQKLIDQPLRKLQRQYGSQNYDHAHYLELQNNLLKTQLRNLKNKYNTTKQQLRQKCDALQKKNEYLQISLRRSQDALHECKRNLEVQMQKIRFQLSRKLQIQVQEEQRRNQRQYIPERDSNLGGNELMQDKLKKIYQQLNEKSRVISNMNLQFNDIRVELQRKSFELKKQQQLNNELSRQLQFARRQNLKNKNMLQQEVGKKMQLNRLVQGLRQKINQLSNQLHLKDRIVNNSEKYENKITVEIQNFKQNQQKLSNEIFELQQQNRKLTQFNHTNEQEIRQLKITINEFTSHIQQLSRSLKQQKQRNVEIEQTYRKMIDQVKESGQRQIQQLQKQFQKYRNLSSQTHLQKQQQFKQKIDIDIKEKDRQINKWKAQYKMLKIKYQQNLTLQNLKRQEVQTYYRSYKEYKMKNKVLQLRNKALQQSANEYIEKIQKIQGQNIQQRAHFLQNINSLNSNCQNLARRAQSLQLQLNDLRQAVTDQSERANHEEAIRKQIQQKILTLDLDGNQGLIQIIQKITKRVNDQDQKVNKYIKQIKNKDLMINKLRQQIRSIMEAQQRQFQNFRVREIQSIIQDIQNRTFHTLQQHKYHSKKQLQIQNQNNNELLAQNTKYKGQIAELTKQLMELRQEAKNISHLYNLKSSQFQQLRDKHKVQIDSYQQKYEQLEKRKTNEIKMLQAELSSKNQQIQSQRNQIKILNSATVNLSREKFDEALKNQIEASKKLKEELSKKNQQVYRIRDSFTLLKAQFDNLKSENDINKLKFISQKKNIQVQGQVEAQQLKNQLSVQQKKVSSLEQKIKIVIDQNKKKDNFIQTYIMGKKLPTNEKQILAAFLKEYEICVTGKNIAEKLQTQSQQLQKLMTYNFSLMKQIAQLKERMLLYEAGSVENSELKQSLSFQGSRRILRTQTMPIDKEDLH